MKRFDPEAIKARAIERMRTELDWALISEDGTVSALLDTFADSEAEMARYMEYLLAEKKWTTAQNESSLNTQVDITGRKSHRKKSAISYVIVSHTDEKGVHRLQNLGKTFFNLDDRSNYDDIIESPNADLFSTQTLVPWTHDIPYTVPKFTRFITGKGTEFIATSAVSSRVLKEPWSLTYSAPTKLQMFQNEGGWNGIKYLKIPVIQGRLKTYNLGISVGERFESFKIPLNNVEDASNNISSHLFRLYVNPTPSVPANKQEWIQTPNLLLTSAYDKVFEIRNLPDYSGIIIKFGDDINGQRLSAGSEITLEYLETAGSEGNVSKKYQISNIVFPENEQMVDPRTGAVSKFLSATNISPMLGGRCEESVEDIRNYAPLDYLQYYAIATTSAYESQIKMYSQIGLDKVKVFGGSSTVSSDIKDIESIKSVLYVTAITSNGEVIENAEDTLIKPVVKAIGNLKAPLDTFEYIEPNFIKLRLNTVVYSDSTNMSSDDIVALEKQALIDRYSIFNRDFKAPFHSSELIQITKSFDFVNYVDNFIEASADVLYDDILKVSSMGPEYPTLYKFPFSFDTVYNQDKYTKGFNNYLQSAPYLLKIELTIKNDPIKASKLNRTFFLYDNRYLYEVEPIPSVEEGKYQFLNGSPIVTNDALFPEWRRPDDTREDYNDRALRLAQFTYIKRITSEKIMTSQVKVPSLAPFEIRPYLQDEDGKNKIFLMDSVEWDPNGDDPRVPLPGDTYCYVKDSRFINHFDVVFEEDYNYGKNSKGAVVLPAEYFEFNNIDVDNYEQFTGALRNFVDIKVFALPLAKDIAPEKWNEILFADSRDIKVERISITSETLG
jgi:hypothetical protein